MLTQIDVIGFGVDAALLLPLAGDDNSIQLRNADGLGPVKADINTVSNGTVPGETITGTSVGKRNIVLTFGLHPNWATQTAAELRAQLYTYFMPESEVTLIFHSTHLPDCATDGTVESMDPNIFSKDPEVQVSVICPDPDFIALTETVINGTTVIDNTFTNINYVGSKPVGVQVDVFPSASTPTYNSTLTYTINRYNGGSMRVSAAGITATSAFRMRSVPGGKRLIKLTGTGLQTESPPNRLDLIVSPYRTWIQLNPGMNPFQVKATTAGLPWTMRYTARFGGL